MRIARMIRRIWREDFSGHFNFWTSNKFVDFCDKLQSGFAFFCAHKLRWNYCQTAYRKASILAL